MTMKWQKKRKHTRSGGTDSAFGTKITNIKSEMSTKKDSLDGGTGSAVCSCQKSEQI